MQCVTRSHTQWAPFNWVKEEIGFGQLVVWMGPLGTESAGYSLQVLLISHSLSMWRLEELIGQNALFAPLSGSAEAHSSVLRPKLFVQTHHCLTQQRTFISERGETRASSGATVTVSERIACQQTLAGRAPGMRKSKLKNNMIRSTNIHYPISNGTKPIIHTLNRFVLCCNFQSARCWKCRVLCSFVDCWHANGVAEQNCYTLDCWWCCHCVCVSLAFRGVSKEQLYRNSMLALCSSHCLHLNVKKSCKPLKSFSQIQYSIFIGIIAMFTIHFIYTERRDFSRPATRCSPLLSGTYSTFIVQLARHSAMQMQFCCTSSENAAQCMQ